MRNRFTLAAVFPVAMMLGACQDVITEPTVSKLTGAASAASVTASGGDTECVGTLPPGTYDNVVVPPGAACLLNSTHVVLGNIKALQGSQLEMLNVDQVGGNIDANNADVVDVFASEIQGSIQIKGATGVARVSNTDLPNGDIRIEKNMGSNIEVVDNDVVGDIKVDRNTSLLILIRDNSVTQDLQVLKNEGPGPKSVVGNSVRRNLSCRHNDQPFVGGPNFANQAHGQCFASPLP